MKVVCDTNILISALIFPGGPPDEVLNLARLRQVTLFLSPDIVAETKAVLIRKFRYTTPQAAVVLARLTTIATLIVPTERVALITRVDADNRILECALATRADYLVTGDKRDLLPLQKVGQTLIVTAAKFLDVMRESPR